MAKLEAGWNGICSHWLFSENVMLLRVNFDVLI